MDPARLLLTGLSQGGHGAWVLGARHLELWAAVVPVCGYARARHDGGVGHGCWERAYGEMELPAWLLAQRRPLP
ncbi:MAG: hypothetical protein B7Z61_00655 [Acidobacteria bacterium 37-71-11]|nr:MAG: hypothetical protein B7Z61_00655 [Acidobacteria bacterium 37-71-11]